jgi:N-(5-amino-5-carboxypentanoyl)-L-cysteinyl-D-valine synthase
VVLWKATRGGDGVADGDRQRLFDYYARSPSNHLDNLLGLAAFAVESLGDNTHFSWVQDEAVVSAIGARICGLAHRAQ